MNNLQVKDALSRHNLKQWELAEMLNVSEFSLSRKMRHELPDEEQKRIVSLIENHVAQEGNKSCQ